MHVQGVSVVVLAYGHEPWLLPCVRSALASGGVDVEVVVVDNGAPADDIDQVAALPGVRVVRPGVNLGFAGGCVTGAAHAQHEVLFFVNSDAQLATSALLRLSRALTEPGVGLACASVRLAGDEGRVNTAGNPLHFTGLSWAGGYGQDAAYHAERRDVAVAAGTCLAVRRCTWDRLGGFWPAYFAYHEDVDLSWRCWQAGLRCVYVPEAVAVHRYEFSRNPRKLFLTERNRLMFVLTTYQRDTLVLVAPGMLVVEVGVLLAAVREGWARQKLAGYRWLWSHRAEVLQRRRHVQAERVRPDRVLLPLMTDVLDPGHLPVSPAARLAARALSWYWRKVRDRLEGEPAAGRRRPSVGRGRS